MHHSCSKVAHVPTALLSVYDKTGIVDLARGLHDLGWRLVSSGGTATAPWPMPGLPVTDLAELTGYPAILGHRVVTLHPVIHGGSARRSRSAGAPSPSLSTTASSRSRWRSSTSTRSARPEHRADRHRRPDVDPRRGQEPRPRRCRDRPRAVRGGARRAPVGGLAVGRDPARAGGHGVRPDRRLRRRDRDLVRPSGRSRSSRRALPATLHLSLDRVQPLRYGENPHQHGARYRASGAHELVGHGGAARRQGAELPQRVRHRGRVAARPPLRPSRRS